MRRLAFIGLSVFCISIMSNLYALNGGSTNNNQSGSGEKAKFSGLMFGDFYYVASNHIKDIEGQNGLWFRRIYFTYDRNLSGDFSVRFRMELNSPGDFKSKNNLEPYVKDAHLKWSKGSHSVLLGISPTLAYEFIDKFWGYRAVEKTPLDLLKFISSRDFGIAFKGTLDKEKKANYALMSANGNGTKSETNQEKIIMASMRYDFSKNVTFEVYADWQGNPDHFDRFTYQGFFGYRSKSGRLGAQFSRQIRQRGKENEDLSLEILSMFYVHNFSERANGIFRMDYIFDPVPDGDKISYIPFDPVTKPKFFLVGLDFMPEKNVHIIPNIEFITYGSTNGNKPDSDVIPRITYYYTW